MLLKLAWRNIWRNTRRTILTIAGVAFGLGICIYSRALGVGFHNQMIRDAIHVFAGHIQVNALHWHGNWTMEYLMDNPDAVFNAIKDDPRIIGAAPRATVPGLISRKLIKAATGQESMNDDESGEENTSTALITGVDPEAEKKITSLPTKMRKGRYISADDPMGVAIGADLAKTLGVDIGDRVLLWTQNYYESLEAKYFFVRGIYKSGSFDLDTFYVFVPLQTVQQFLQLDRMVTTVTIVLKDSEYLDPVTNSIKGNLDPKVYEVLKWTDFKPEIWQYVVFDDIGGYMFLGILMIVVVFGILNTQLMAVFERTREFGAMLALGTRPSRVALLVFIECAMMTAVGVVFGNLLGLLAAYINSRAPIDLSRDAAAYEVFGIDPRLYAAVLPFPFVICTCLIFSIALVMSLWPAFRAARYKPVDALRHV